MTHYSPQPMELTRVARDSATVPPEDEDYASGYGSYDDGTVTWDRRAGLMSGRRTVTFEETPRAHVSVAGEREPIKLSRQATSTPRDYSPFKVPPRPATPTPDSHTQAALHSSPIEYDPCRQSFPQPASIAQIPQE